MAAERRTGRLLGGGADGVSIPLALVAGLAFALIVMLVPVGRVEEPVPLEAQMPWLDLSRGWRRIGEIADRVLPQTPELSVPFHQIQERPEFSVGIVAQGVDRPRPIRVMAREVVFDDSGADDDVAEHDVLALMVLRHSSANTDNERSLDSREGVAEIGRHVCRIDFAVVCRVRKNDVVSANPARRIGIRIHTRLLDHDVIIALFPKLVEDGLDCVGL